MSLSAKMREELRRRIECVYQAKVITWESKDRLIGKLADWEDWQEDRLRRWEALIPVVKSEPTHCLCPQCGEVAEIRVGKFWTLFGDALTIGRRVVVVRLLSLRSPLRSMLIRWER